MGFQFLYTFENISQYMMNDQVAISLKNILD